MKRLRMMAALTGGLWREVLAAAFLSALAAGLGLYLISRLGSLIASGETRELFTLALLLPVLPAVTVVARMLLSRMVQEVTYQVRRELIGRVMAASTRRVEELSAAKIYATLSTDVQQISILLGNIPVAMFNALMLVFGLGYVATLSVTVLAVVGAAACLNIGISVVIQRRAIGAMRAHRAAQGELFHAYEALAYGKKEFMLSEQRRTRFLGVDVEGMLDRYRNASVRTDLHWALVVAWGEVALLLLLMILALRPGSSAALAPAMLAQVALILFYLRGPVGVLVDTGQQLSYAGIALQNVTSLALDDAAPAGAVAAGPAPAQSIDYRGVGFRYLDAGGDKQFTVGPVDLTLRAGEVAFITGGNGSGKSSLCRLIAGLYESESGAVLADGHRVCDAAFLRAHTVALFSDYFAFDSLPVAPEKFDAPLRAKVEFWLETLRLSHKTGLAGVRWTNSQLSSGQRRRLALVSMLCEDKAVFLFDEPTADQDPEMRAHFYDTVLPQLRARGKIVVVVSHDERYFDRADRVYVLADGRLSERPPVRRAARAPGTQLAGWAMAALLGVCLAAAPVGRAEAAAGPGFDGARALDTLQALQTAAGGPHPTGSQANQRVGGQIAARLAAQGWTPEWQFSTVCRGASCTTLANLVAAHLPEPGAPALLLAAHYDSAPASPGAADDGLAVAAMLEMAHVHAHGQGLGNVVLLFSDGEEEGMLGARAFVREHPLMARIGYVVNMDSIGSDGPLTAYHLGGDAQRTAAWLAGGRGLLRSSLVAQLSAHAAHGTDLDVFTGAGVAGLGMGFLARDDGYHLSGDRIERLGRAQFDALGAVLERAVRDWPRERGGVKMQLVALPGGGSVGVPDGWLWAAAAAAALGALAWTRRAAPAQRRAALRAALWIAVALVFALALAFLLGIAGTGLGIGLPWQRLLLPLAPMLCFWAVLGVAAPSDGLAEGTIGLGLLLALASLVWLPGLAPLALAPLAACMLGLWWRPGSLAGPLLALALGVCLYGPLLFLIAPVGESSAGAMAAAMWCCVWLQLAPLFARRRAMGRAGLALLVGGAVVAQASAQAGLPASTPQRVRVDRIERIDQGLAYIVVDSGGARGQGLRLPGFRADGLQVLPWRQAGAPLTRTLACCASTAASAAHVQGKRLEVRLDGADAQSYTFVFPQQAGVSRVLLGDQSFAVEANRTMPGYSVFVLRDGLVRHRSLSFELADPRALGGAYLITERRTGQALRSELAALGESTEPDYVPDRLLTVERLVAPEGIVQAAGRR
jgi:putative ATP-binding cassette transporter